MLWLWRRIPQKISMEKPYRESSQASQSLQQVLYFLYLLSKPYKALKSWQLHLNNVKMLLLKVELTLMKNEIREAKNRTPSQKIIHSFNKIKKSTRF
jgi:hypothetical protein